MSQMNVEPERPTVKNPPEQFAGDVWLTPVVAPHEAGQRTSVGLVRFAPGARTAWHSHARGQYLHIVSGTALIGGRDGTVIEAHAGQTVYTPPDEEHWHGASSDSFMEHYAILEAGDDPEHTTTWMEHVAE
jgi:quercetin dioxygenase-like cupin family protein